MSPKAALDPDRNLYKRGDIYQCRYVLNGREERSSLRTTDVRQAREARDALLKAADNAREGIAPDVVYIWQDAVGSFVSEMLDPGRVYSKTTARRYAVSLRQLSPVLEGQPLSEITTRTVLDYAFSRTTEGVSVSTIKNDLTAWSMVMSHAELKKMVPENPLRRCGRKWLGQDAEVVNPPTDAEVAAMVIEVATWSPEMSNLMIWLRETGMRLLEALLIEVSDVHPDGKSATLTRGVKNNRKSGKKTRTIQIGRAAEMLHRLPKRGRLFPGLHTDSTVVSTRYGQWKRQRQQREVLAAAEQGRKAELLRMFRLHDLRHAFAIATVIDSPRRIYDLEKHLGHSSIKTTELYIRLLKREGHRAGARDASLHGSLPAKPRRLTRAA